MRSPYSSRVNYIRSGYRWCVVLRKPGSAWLEDTPAMDHGINGKCIHMSSNKRDMEQNIHQETHNMDKEHTRKTISICDR